MFCSVLNLLKIGCTWRALPGDFPGQTTVRYYFDLWTKMGDTGSSLFAQALKNLVTHECRRNGRAEKTSFYILDAQSVKNADTAQSRGYDAGKKVSGIKRHLAVDTEDLPHAIEVTTANVNDREAGILTLLLNTDTLSDVVRILIDSGYSGESFSRRITMMLGAAVEIARRPQPDCFLVDPQRWVVERSFAWLDRCRRLCKKLRTYTP